AVLLVPGQPDVAHAAGAQRADGPVAAENQLLGERGRRHASCLTLRLGEVLSDRAPTMVPGNGRRRRHPVRLLRGRSGDDGGGCRLGRPSAASPPPEAAGRAPTRGGGARAGGGPPSPPRVSPSLPSSPSPALPLRVL